MEVTRDRVSLWEALAGRAPGRPTGPADTDLWDAVVERLNPARSRPVLRPGIEEARLTSVRGQPYVMLRSPDREAAYVRLTPEEVELAHLMDGNRTVAQLVREFVRISGRLAPEQVTRTVADLAANRMLDELPIDAFRPVANLRRRRGAARVGRGVVEAAKGRRVVLADFDRPAGLLYRAGGRLLFTRPATIAVATLAIVGVVLFVTTWVGGAERLFLTANSYAAGGLLLLVLNILALLTHELGHALAVKHAGRRVPAIGFLFYFGVPSAFVDTTDVWMKGRRARLLTSVAGPLSALTMAGLLQLVALVWPELSPIAFRLAFMWYLNALFNLNPLMALDGYYLAMDWLEIPNLRARGMASLVRAIRTRSIGWAGLDREGRFVALYGFLAALWLVVFLGIAVRMWRDRFAGLAAGLWHAGWASRALVIVFVLGLFGPLVAVTIGWAGRRIAATRRGRAERAVQADEPARVAALRTSRFGSLPAEALAALAADARWVEPLRGSEVAGAHDLERDVLVVVEGRLDGRCPGDPPGTVRARASAGEVVGLRAALTGVSSGLVWLAVGARLLRIPAATVARTVGPIVGPVPPDRAEADGLLRVALAFVGLGDEQHESLLRRLEPIHLAPGDMLRLEDPDRGVIVDSGSLDGDDGAVFGRGDLLVPVSEDRPLRAVAHTTVRGWTASGLDGLHLFGAPGKNSSVDGRSPEHGAHGGDHHGPLAAPPTPVPPPGDDDVDRRLQRRLARLVALALLLALLAIPLALAPDTGWAEIGDDNAVLEVLHGEVMVLDGDQSLSFEATTRLTVRPLERIEVGERSTAHLTFAGGATQVLCAGTHLEVAAIGRDEVVTDDRSARRQTLPHSELVLLQGRILADTRPERATFLPLHLTVTVAGRTVVADGGAAFSVDPARVTVERGPVSVGGVPLAEHGPSGGCPGATDVLGAALAHGTAPVEVIEEVVEFDPRLPSTTLRRGLVEDPASQPDMIPLPVAPEEPDDAGPDPTATTPESEPQPTSQSDLDPIIEPDPDPEPDPGPDPDPDPEPDPDPDPEPDPDPDPEPDPDPDPDPGPTPGYTLACQPPALTLSHDSSASTSCTVTPTDGFVGTVNLRCENLPVGVTCAWSSGSGNLVVGDDQATLRLTVTVSREATPGASSFDVVAVGGDVARSTPIALRIPT